MGLINQLPREIKNLIIELARLSHELAAEHSRSIYGEPSSGLTPGMIYDNASALRALSMARRAKEIVNNVLDTLNVVP